MTSEIAIVLLSVAFGIAADYFYFKGIKEGFAHNRWSWLIFAIGSIVEVLTYDQITADPLKVIIYSFTPIACFILMLRVWKIGTDKWDSRLDMIIDVVSVIATIVAMVLWLCFKRETWAHVLMVIAVPVSYIPLWKSVGPTTKPNESLPWILWTIMDVIILAFVLHRLDTPIEIPYGIAELFCHGSMWFLTSFRRSA